MPFTLSPVSRRRFLGSALSSAAAVAVGCARTPEAFSDLPAPLLPELPAPARNPDHVVLLSDVHVSSNPWASVWGGNMNDHLEQAVSEIVGLDAAGGAPGHVLVNGDCAFSSGATADYRRLLKLLRPLRDSGVPLHLGLGNHDDRDRLAAAVPVEQQAVTGRRTMLLELPRANVIMLDSLDRTNANPGLLGDEQVRWLAGVLDAPRHRGKPAVVMVHHNPQTVSRIAGIEDTPALMDTLLPRRQVKALLFGHTHFCFHRVEQGLHLVNLPATGYVFAGSEPTAWTDCRLTDSGATLTLNAVGKPHRRDGETFRLGWRA